jgi:hypothetical protein
MPFGGDFDDYYKSIYKRAIEMAEMSPVRADDIYHAGPVMQQIWDMIRTAKLVLADLTEKRANVFYEIGVAHSLWKQAILVAPSNDAIPFDLHHLRVIFYDKNRGDWGRILRDDIAKALKETLDSPQRSLLPPYSGHKLDLSRPEAGLARKALQNVSENLDLLNREVASVRLALKVGPLIVESGKYVFSMEPEDKSPTVRVQRTTPSKRSGDSKHK